MHKLHKTLNIHSKISFFIGTSCEANNVGARLKEKLFAKYDKNKHIIKNVSNTTVKVGLSVIQADIDEKNRILVLDAWMRLKWSDKDLTWNKSEFDLSVVRVPYDEVWRPDMMLYNK